MWALAQQNYFLDLAKASGNSRRNCLIGILFFNFNSCIFYINASVFFELPPARERRFLQSYSAALPGWEFETLLKKL